jgi:tetratricopeptide (TPR) repeat protein
MTLNISPSVAGLLSQGEIACEVGNLSQASNHYSAALAEARHLHDKFGEATAFLRLGVLNRTSIGDLKRARSFLQQSLQVCESIPSDEGRASVMCELGAVSALEKHYDESADWYKAALEIFRRYQNKDGEGTVLNQMGVLEKRQGEWDRAEKLFRSSLHIYEELGDEQSISWVLINLSDIVVRHRHDYPQGRLILHRALAIYEKLGLNRETEKTKHNLEILEKMAAR